MLYNLDISTTLTEYIIHVYASQKSAARDAQVKEIYKEKTNITKKETTTKN